MKLLRKGQGAMEYLMTYGWAILVVMIVGVTLWGLGIFGGGPGAVNTASGFSKVKVLEPSIKYEYTEHATDQLKYVLKFSLVNGVGSKIKLENITWGGDCEFGIWPAMATPWIGFDLDNNGVVGDYFAPIGGTEWWQAMAADGSAFTPLYDMYLNPGETPLTGIARCRLKNPGESFVVPITITYSQTIAGESIEHKDTGVVRGAAE